MLREPQEYEAVFQELKADLQNSEEKNVLVFASTAECDSVCAVRILQLLLMNSGVHFSTFPVSGASEIKQICETQLTGEVQYVVMVNCGGASDIVQLLGLQNESETRVIIADSHRPMHHNAPHLQHVHYLVGEGEAEALRASMPPAEGASDSDEEDAEDDPMEGASDDEDEEDKENDRPAKRQRVSADAAYAGIVTASQRRARRRARREGLRHKWEAYYAAGTSWGRPAALTLLDLAQQLHLDDRHFLWLGIVGLTDQYVHQRITPGDYAEAVHRLEMMVDQLGDDEAGGGDDMEAVPVEDEHGHVSVVRRKRLVFGQIKAVEDLRFPLMRHWSVYDAITHSRYVAVRLATWQERGRRTVDELLCRMGFSQRDCKQDYCVTARKFASLAAKLTDHAHTFRLPDLTYRSFRQQWGSASPLYAADVVLAATALLEAPPLVRAGEAAPRDDKSDQFWKAWNCLAVRDSGELQQGIELSKRLQRAILSDGGLLIVSKAGQERARFRWFDMTRNEVSNKAILAHPLALAKLGMFLRDVASQRASAAAKRKPIVLVGPANADGMCLVVGVTCEPFLAGGAEPEQQRAAMGNTFGRLFLDAAEKADAKICSDGFDSSVIELAVADVDRFIRRLSVLAVRAQRARPDQAAQQPAAAPPPLQLSGEEA